MNQNKLTFDTENLGVDWVGFNIEGSIDLEPIANYLFELLGFNSTITKKINGKWKSESLNYDKLNKFQVSFRQYDYNPEFKSYWVGTQVIFSGKGADYFFKLIKTEIFDWNLLKFDGHSLSLGRIDLCFSRPNGCSHTIKLFDEFLVNSRSQIQDHTNTRHIRLQDFTDGKILKVNRKNNSVHYRV